MTTRELAAGVVMTGFEGTTTGDARALLASAPFAGFILFARNVESLAQARALTDELRALSETAPLIAIDQEGGRVARIRDGVTEIPSMMALGATRSPELGRAAGEQLAFDLRRAGFNIDFAPVLDLALQRGNIVIGTRAFGSAPKLVADLGGAVASGMRTGGIASCGKHFPGHGATSVDSHEALPRLEVDERTMMERDFVPFARNVDVVSSMMVAHVVVPDLDPELPASISPRILTGLLRDTMHYDGVCFTDCMQMEAIAGGIGSVEGVAAAIAAGADCAIISDDPALALRAVDHLVTRVERGELSLERLREAHARVKRLRASLGAPLPFDAQPPHPSIGREIARRAVTLVRGTAHADATACAVVSFAPQGRLTAQVAALVNADASAPEPRRRTIVLSYRAHLDSGQQRAIEAMLAERPDTIVVSTAEPYDVTLFPQARHLLACYGDGDASMAGLADVLFSAHPAEGRMPVDL